MLARRPMLCVFLGLAPLLAFVFWLQADWWAYMGTGPDRKRKFIMPWWWQLGMSSIVGVGASGLLAGLVHLLRVGWSWLAHR
jgi:hypothetical protein